MTSKVIAYQCQFVGDGSAARVAISDQQRVAMSVAKQQGLTVVGHYDDRDVHHDGTPAECPNLIAAVKQCRDGKVDGIVIAGRHRLNTWAARYLRDQAEAHLFVVYVADSALTRADGNVWVDRWGKALALADPDSAA